MVEFLLKRLDPNYTHNGKRCMAIETVPSNPSRSVVRFMDGTSAEADVVLVANGVKSQLREVVSGIPSNKSVSFSNAACYRGLVVRETASAKGVDTSLWNVPSRLTGVGKVCMATESSCYISLTRSPVC